jgi:pimeloyl-ACP methyl ester carboxylesterase
MMPEREPDATAALCARVHAMETLRSKDGTRIAYRRSGQGPPLVLVHGTAGDHTRWLPILPRLEERFTVIAVDRRGRGGSGDAEPYAIEREFDDVAAVVDAIGAPVALLGHSYGAVCALEASVLTGGLRALLLYEPPVPVGTPLYPPGLAERLEGMLALGEREAVVTTFMREVPRLPETEIALLQGLPSWPGRVAAAHTIPREIRFVERYRFEPARVAALRVPTVLFLGGDSPPVFRDATEVVRAAIPASRLVVFPGQQHTAMNTDPEMFVREVFAALA